MAVAAKGNDCSLVMFPTHFLFVGIDIDEILNHSSLCHEQAASFVVILGWLHLKTKSGHKHALSMFQSCAVGLLSVLRCMPKYRNHADMWSASSCIIRARSPLSSKLREQFGYRESVAVCVAFVFGVCGDW